MAPTEESIYYRPAKAERRVVVTGLGCVSPVGNSTDSAWENALKGNSGIDRITQFDASDFQSQIAGEVRNFDPLNFIPKKEIKKMDRFIQLAIAASDEALSSSGLEISESVSDRVGTIVGVGMGGLGTIETMHSTLMDRGPSRVSPFFIPMVIPNLAAGQIAMRHGCHGPNYAISSACSSGAHAIGEAVRSIRHGVADVMVAGGAESAICPLSVAGFSSMRALSTRNAQPQMASRPFDQDRDGFVVGEGAAILILEDYEHAARRNAQILCEVSGYGLTCDAHHTALPHPEGKNAARCMQMALDDAKLNAESIDYINAHGTSTPAGDGIESKAIRNTMKDHADKVWVSSTKSVTGHLLGAAGAIESLFCVLSLRDNVVPPTINLDNPSDDCDLDYVPIQARDGDLKHVMNNSFGFGGTNACLVFSKTR